MNKLKNAHIAVFGIGGVGGYVVEALARSGIGALDLIDNDIVSKSNINRQIIALDSTIGQYKVDVAAARIADINPDCKVIAHRILFVPNSIDMLDFSKYDYVIDTIDMVSGKVEIIMRAKAVKTSVISSMGTGNKLDPTAFVITDIYNTSICPLARILRHEMKKRNVDRLKVVYSTEQAIVPRYDNSKKHQTFFKHVIGSTSFVPSVAGFIIASEVIKDIVGKIK